MALTDAPTDNALKSTAEDWEHIASLFKGKSAMRPTRAWFNGMSTRLDYKRVSRLRSGKAATELQAYLSALPEKRIKTLRTFSAINQEQALAAFKTTLVGNVSAPILLLTFANQMTDGALSKGFVELSKEGSTIFFGLLGGLVGGIFAIVFVAIYALASLNQARDLRHLLDLHAAERGIYFGLEDMDDLNLS